MASTPYLPLGRRLRQLRTDQRPKCTQEQLAKRVGCSPSMVSALERGLYRLEPDMIDAYVRELGADYNELSRLSGYLRNADVDWVPPRDKAPQLRTIADLLTPAQLNQAVGWIRTFFNESVERDIPTMKAEEGEGELGRE